MCRGYTAVGGISQHSFGIISKTNLVCKSSRLLFMKTNAHISWRECAVVGSAVSAVVRIYSHVNTSRWTVWVCTSAVFFEKFYRASTAFLKFFIEIQNAPDANINRPVCSFSGPPRCKTYVQNPPSEFYTVTLVLPFWNIFFISLAHNLVSSYLLVTQFFFFFYRHYVSL